MSKLSFKTFCIEYYAQHIGKPGNEVYDLFTREKLLDMLDSDYEDLRGMGMEYLMNFFYLSGWIEKTGKIEYAQETPKERISVPERG